MSDGFTKVKISLVLTVVHICLIHTPKAQIFVYLMMYGRSQSDFSLNMALIILKVYQHVHNIHFEGNVSQHFKRGFIFIFMSKNGKIFIIFS